MTAREASCSCGNVRVACDGEPVRISMCHCLACQRRTGSVFGVQARFPKDRVAVLGGAVSEYVRTADSGNTITFRFCPRCGSTVYYTLSEYPDVIAVTVGSFADPKFPAPRHSVYESRRHHWVVPPDAPGIEHLD